MRLRYASVLARPISCLSHLVLLSINRGVALLSRGATTTCRDQLIELKQVVPGLSRYRIGMCSVARVDLMLCQ